MAFHKIVVVVAYITTCALALPRIVDVDRPHREPRQDDDDGTTRAPVDFGAHVAQIIAGAFTGNIDSIIKGSFGFIDDPMVNKLSHNTWETLKGNPTKSPAWEVDVSTTVRESEPERQPEPPQPAPLLQQSQSLPPAPVTPAAIVPSPVPVQSFPVQSQPAAAAPSGVFAPDVYYPGSPYYPTRSPVRSTQPTYATLAPLSVIEGTAETEAEPEETSTPPSTTEEDEDGDEAEGVSNEIGEGASTSASASGTKYSIRKTVTTAATITTGNVETTTEDDDQDQIDYRL